ncbi:MAG: acyl-CoA dehydrogenase [Planctomycetales bacterium]|nr:acyl-CoA dehydrogenase [Planctomycetales bacterium]
MKNRRSRPCKSFSMFFLLLYFCSGASNVDAQLPESQTRKSTVTAEVALSVLQTNHMTSGDLLVEQGELDPLIAKSGGGACPTAAVGIAFQALRVMSGMKPHTSPHRLALEAFRNSPDLLNGRLSNKQVVDLLLHYQKHLENSKLAIRVQSAPNSPYATDANIWEVTGRPDLTIQPREIKILSYTVSEPSGHVLGRHFVILKKLDGDKLLVVDPQSPGKDRRYMLEAGGAERCGRYFLRYPPEFQRPYTNELNTVFTVRVEYADSTSRDFGQIKTLIDATAKKLKLQNKLRSPRDWRRETASFGLPALDLPIDVGGFEWSAEQMLEVFRYAGRYDLNLRDVVGGAHSRILLHADAPEAIDLLRGVVKGERYFAITITEPDYGSDFTSMQSTSQKVDGGYILNGQKRFNARLDQATDVIVITKNPDGQRGKLNVFVLPINSNGLSIETFGAHGLTGNSYGGMTMNDVFVPDHFLIGEDGNGYEVFSKHFLYWRLMQTAAAIGTAEQALQQMADRLKTRIVFGGPIGRFTHLQQPMGQHTTELKMAHALAVQAAKLIDEDRYSEAEPLINGLKAEGVEIALKAVDAAARAFGGEGYSDLVDIGDRLRDLNGLRIADGTTDVMRSAVVRSQFGREFWDMANQGNFEKPEPKLQTLDTR